MSHQYGDPRELHEIIADRQHDVCPACSAGIPRGTGHLHHRVRRSVLGWCPCNLVLLHPQCHSLGSDGVHARPEWGRSMGLIVPTWTDPRTVPVPAWPYLPRMYLRCDASISFTSELVSAPDV